MCSVAAPATLVLELPEVLPPLSAAVEVALYRIAAEAITNIVRHADATCCSISLAAAQGPSGGTLHLNITDDAFDITVSHLLDALESHGMSLVMIDQVVLEHQRGHPARPGRWAGRRSSARSGR